MSWDRAGGVVLKELALRACYPEFYALFRLRRAVVSDGVAPISQHNPENRNENNHQEVERNRRNGAMQGEALAGVGVYTRKEAARRQLAETQEASGHLPAGGRTPAAELGRIRVQKPERFLSLCGETRDAWGGW